MKGAGRPANQKALKELRNIHHEIKRTANKD
jgi:hypothetical protein